MSRGHSLIAHCSAGVIWGKSPVGTGKNGAVRLLASSAAKSLPKILRRVAYPVEPFGFKSVQNGPPAPLLGGNRDRLGEHPRLFD